MIHGLQIKDSSMISAIVYDEKSLELEVSFKEGFFLKGTRTFIDVPYKYYLEFISTESVGKYFNNVIKKLFILKPQKTSIMAEEKKRKVVGMNRASDKKRFIEFDLDLSKINKDWIIVGQKGGLWAKLVFSLLPDGEVDRFENCGMVTHKVPQDVYKADKNVKGPILGNGIEIDWEATKELNGGGASGPGDGKMVKDLDPNDVTEPMDDLPF